jgi:hypothetical protein
MSEFDFDKERETAIKRELFIKKMIDAAFSSAVSEAMKVYQKTGSKRVEDVEIRRIITTALVLYKTGIMEALRI